MNYSIDMTKIAEMVYGVRDETTLLTSFGSVTYHKTLFKNVQTGEHEYLLDHT